MQTVTGVDFAVNAEAHHSLTLSKNVSPKETYTHIESSLTSILNGSKIDCIVNVAGGWAGGNVADPNLFENLELMHSQSVVTSVITTRLASFHLKNGGLLVLTGAGAATHGTPGMVAYGLAKAAVHHLVRSCAGPDSGIPAGGKVVGILPVMLDTPMNRKFMGGADTSTWTPLEEVGNEVLQWAEGSKQVANGELYKIITEHSKTQFMLVK
jgi:dihydropteridine reductase